MRGVVQALGLARDPGHSVDRVVGEERVPLGVASVVEQARLADHEVDQLALADVAHCPAPIAVVMWRAQARYWLRIEISLVPTVVTSARPISAASKLRCRLTHGLPLACRPAWMPR